MQECLTILSGNQNMPQSNYQKFRRKAWLAFKRAFFYDTRPTEFWSICFLLWWAILLAAKPVFSTSDAFNYLAFVSPEMGWSTCCFVLAILHIMGLVFDWYELRRFCCFIISFFWLCVAVLLFIAKSFSTGTGVYSIIAISMLWVFWRGPHNNKILYVELDENGQLIKRAL